MQRSTPLVPTPMQYFFIILMKFIIVGNNEKCSRCDKLYEYCICDYDVIGDIPEFIKTRSMAIYKLRKKYIDEINKSLKLIRFTSFHIPMAYTPRCGHSIEEFPNCPHSGHDTSRVIGSLLISEINELIVNLSCGSNRSALRTTRSMMEWVIRVVAAISNRQIFSGLNSDKNMSLCYERLTEVITFHEEQKFMMMGDKEKRKSFEKDKNKLKELNESKVKIPWYAFKYNANIPDGLGGIPEKLNDQILSNIKIVHNKTKESEIGSSAIRLLYHLLSEYVHNSVDAINEIPQDGSTSFLNIDEFDNVYSILIPTIDIIFYHYFILVDMDVYYEKTARIEYRKKIKEMFLKSKFSKKSFHSCFKLLGSDIWNDPNKEFINH